MKPFERFLIGLDSGPLSVMFRVGMGLGIAPLFRAFFGDHASIWLFPAFFIGLLVALRVVPAVLRLALPFSAEAKAIWAERRALAKRYDSYQWKKLFWIALGLLLYLVFAGNARNSEIVIVLICLIGGGVGQWVWRRTSDSHRPSRSSIVRQN
jgi:hypothetical protein